MSVTPKILSKQKSKNNLLLCLKTNASYAQISKKNLYKLLTTNDNCKYLGHSWQKTFNPLSAKFMKWSNTLKQFVGNLPTNCLSGFDHFVGLALKGLKNKPESKLSNILKTLKLKQFFHVCLWYLKKIIWSFIILTNKCDARKNTQQQIGLLPLILLIY